MGKEKEKKNLRKRNIIQGVFHNLRNDVE